MKKYISFFCTFLFAVSVFTAIADAKTGKEIAEQIAPLVNKNTVFVSHIDFTALDFKAICERSLANNEAVFKTLNLDEKSVRGLSRETRKLVLKGQEKTQTYLDFITKKCKISDVYLLLQGIEEENEPIPMFSVAIPTKNRSSAQKEALDEILEQFLEWEYISEVFEQDGFQIFIIYGEEEPTIPLEAAKKEFNDKENEKLLPLLSLGFSQSEKSDIRSVAFLKQERWDELKPNELNSTDPSQKREKEIEILMQKVGFKIQFISNSIDLNHGKFTLNVHTKSKEDVESIKSDLMKVSEILSEGFCEEIIKNGKENHTDLSFLAPFIQEFAKGTIKALIPKSEDSRFVVKCESELVNAAFVNYMLIASHFVLSPLEDD